MAPCWMFAELEIAFHCKLGKLMNLLEICGLSIACIPYALFVPDFVVYVHCVVHCDCICWSILRDMVLFATGKWNCGFLLCEKCKNCWYAMGFTGFDVRFFRLIIALFVIDILQNRAWCLAFYIPFFCRINLILMLR